MTTSAVNAVKQVLKVGVAGPTQTEDEKLSMNPVDNLDDGQSMRAAVWNGKKTVNVVTRPVPKITDPVSIQLFTRVECCLCDCKLRSYRCESHYTGNRRTSIKMHLKPFCLL